MGVRVLNVTLSSSNGGRLRGYAHCGLPPSPWVPRDTEPSDIGVVLVNLDTSANAAVHLPGARSDTWSLTPASSADGVATLINAHPLPSNISDGAAIDDIPVPPIRGSGAQPVTLPALSVSFVRVNGLSMEACAP